MNPNMCCFPPFISTSMSVNSHLTPCYAEAGNPAFDHASHNAHVRIPISSSRSYSEEEVDGGGYVAIRLRIRPPGLSTLSVGYSQ